MSQSESRTHDSAGRPEAAAEAPASVLFLGAAALHVQQAVEVAASRSNMEFVAPTSSSKVADWLSKNRPKAIVIDATLRDAEQACVQVRDNPHLGNVPILGLVDAMSDLAFEEIFGWGGDDIALRGQADSLMRRLRALSVSGGAPLAKRHGVALIADPDRRRRILLGRVLRNAGYNVTFAGDAAETLSEAMRDNVELVVSSWQIEEEATWKLEADAMPSVAARARAAGVKAAWVVGAPYKERARARELYKGVASLDTFDAFSAPDNVLFVANEIARAGRPDGRASARLLFGTAVRFRPAGGEEDEIGFSYNLSAGGLYVRTLVPVPRGTDVWVEFSPPRSDRRVRLEGRSVWARSFGPNDSATVPPGFGLQFGPPEQSDLDRHVQACAQLTES